MYNLPFSRYSDELYSAAVAAIPSSTKILKSAKSYFNLPWSQKDRQKSFPVNALQAYTPSSERISTWPYNTALRPQTASNGDPIGKYAFVIVSVGGGSGNGTTAGSLDTDFQMRIHPEEFYPAAAWGFNCIMRDALLATYRLWSLAGEPDAKIYAAGNIYVNLTRGKIIGLDTRSAHFFKAFEGHDMVIAEDTAELLCKLGYDTRGLELYDDMWMWLMDNTDGMA